MVGFKAVVDTVIASNGLGGEKARAHNKLAQLLEQRRIALTNRKSTWGLGWSAESPLPPGQGLPPAKQMQTHGYPCPSAAHAPFQSSYASSSYSGERPPDGRASTRAAETRSSRISRSSIGRFIPGGKFMSRRGSTTERKRFVDTEREQAERRFSIFSMFRASGSSEEAFEPWQ